MSNSTPPPTNFGSIPYLALPTLALIMVVIGVAIATDRRNDREARETPTAIVQPTHMNPTVNTLCTVVEEREAVIIFSCPKPVYEYGPR